MIRTSTQAQACRARAAAAASASGSPGRASDGPTRSPPGRRRRVTGIRVMMMTRPGGSESGRGLVTVRSGGDCVGNHWRGSANAGELHGDQPPGPVAASSESVPRRCEPAVTPAEVTQADSDRFQVRPGVASQPAGPRRGPDRLAAARDSETSSLSFRLRR
jgi:hypothetical protein